MNKLLWLLIRYIAEGYNVANNNEVMFLNGGNLISYQGIFYRKMTNEEVIKEIPNFCKQTPPE